jgi:hypothetical protein
MQPHFLSLSVGFGDLVPAAPAIEYHAAIGGLAGFHFSVTLRRDLRRRRPVFRIREVRRFFQRMVACFRSVLDPFGEIARTVKTENLVAAAVSDSSGKREDHQTLALPVETDVSPDFAGVITGSFCGQFQLPRRTVGTAIQVKHVHSLIRTRNALNLNQPGVRGNGVGSTDHTSHRTPNCSSPLIVHQSRSRCSHQKDLSLAATLPIYCSAIPTGPPRPVFTPEIVLAGATSPLSVLAYTVTELLPKLPTKI